MKHEIEIEGLPEGWRAVSYRPPKIGEMVHDGDMICECTYACSESVLILEKIKPRRIVLEETEENNMVLKMDNGETYYVDQQFDSVVVVDEPKIWREVEEGK